MVCWQAMIGNNQEVAQKKNKKKLFCTGAVLLWPLHLLNKMKKKLFVCCLLYHGMFKLPI